MKLKLYFSLSLLMLLAVFSLLPVVSAIGEELFYEPEKNISIELSCFDTDIRLCNAGVNCEVTVYYPNMTLLLNNGSMTYQNNRYNYSDINGLTLPLGVYRAFANCHDTSTSGYTDWIFYVGRPSTESQNNISIVGIVLLLIISAGLFWGFMKFTKAPVKYTFLVGSVLFLVVSINITSIMISDQAGSPGMRAIYDNLGAASYYIYWFLGGMLLIIWILTMVSTMIDRKRMQEARATGQPIDFERNY